MGNTFHDLAPGGLCGAAARFFASRLISPARLVSGGAHSSLFTCFAHAFSGSEDVALAQRLRVAVLNAPQTIIQRLSLGGDGALLAMERLLQQRRPPVLAVLYERMRRALASLHGGQPTPSDVSARVTTADTIILAYLLNVRVTVWSYASDTMMSWTVTPPTYRNSVELFVENGQFFHVDPLHLRMNYTAGLGGSSIEATLSRNVARLSTDLLANRFHLKVAQLFTPELRFPNVQQAPTGVRVTGIVQRPQPQAPSATHLALNATAAPSTATTAAHSAARALPMSAITNPPAQLLTAPLPNDPSHAAAAAGDDEAPTGDVASNSSLSAKLDGGSAPMEPVPDYSPHPAASASYNAVCAGALTGSSSSAATAVGGTAAAERAPNNSLQQPAAAASGSEAPAGFSTSSSSSVAIAADSDSSHAATAAGDDDKPAAAATSNSLPSADAVGRVPSSHGATDDDGAPFGFAASISSFTAAAGDIAAPTTATGDSPLPPVVIAESVGAASRGPSPTAPSEGVASRTRSALARAGSASREPSAATTRGAPTPLSASSQGRSRSSSTSSMGTTPSTTGSKSASVGPRRGSGVFRPVEGRQRAESLASGWGGESPRQPEEPSLPTLPQAVRVGMTERGSTPYPYAVRRKAATVTEHRPTADSLAALHPTPTAALAAQSGRPPLHAPLRNTSRVAVTTPATGASAAGAAEGPNLAAAGPAASAAAPPVPPRRS